MKLFFNTILLCLSIVKLSSQTAINQAIWQQNVNYVIAVSLNVPAQSVEGAIELSYFNNSPQALNEIILHIWPNAYKNTSTPFAKQQLKNGKIDFEFFTESQRGNISQLSFTSKGKTLKWQYFPNQEDIIRVVLDQPLLSGDSIKIQTPFKVKLPELISRGGKGNAAFYAITQWYPKPAVFDVNGWHPMSYLDQGEFYSEFGNFDVSITVPDSITVAATGNMVEFKDTQGYKTYRFVESNIHDFAWFASSRFVHLKKQIQLSDSSKVMLEVYGNKLDYKKSSTGLAYLDSAVRLYSKLVGNYPYKTCKLVVGNLKAGEGMEYPTITICKDLDPETIVHEVGHNWFYGIIGSDERTYPWMDESINSYFDKRVTNYINPDLCKEITADPDFYGNMTFKKWLNSHTSLIGYKGIASQFKTQALSLPSESYTYSNYGVILYGKGPLAFAYLNQVLGDSVFLNCFQNYYRQWQFKHPLPGDIQKSFETSSGKNLAWFFNDILNDNNQIDVREKGGFYSVKGSSKLDSLIKQTPQIHPNPSGFMMEKNFHNNGQKKALLGWYFPFSLPSYNKNVHVNLTPFMGYNIYDGLYPVLAINNSLLNQRAIDYTIIPGYSFKNKNMNGYARITGKRGMSGVFDMMELGVQSQLYGLTTSSKMNQYYRVQPFIKLRFKNAPKSLDTRMHYLLLNFTHTGLKNDHYLIEKDTLGNLAEQRFSKDYFYNYTRIEYGLDNGHPINRLAFKLQAEYGVNNRFNPGSSEYIKTWMNLVFKHQYKKKKFFRSEVFAGMFLKSKGDFENKKFFLSSNAGNRDYIYSDVLMGRNETRYNNTSIFGRQLVNRGGIRQMVDIEASDRWMATMSNEIDFPGALPISFYLDLGVYRYMHRVNNVNAGLKMDFYQTGGIQINMFKRTLEVFIPVFSSSQFKAFNLINNSFLNTIGFKLNLNQLNPLQMISNATIYGKTGVGSQP